MKLPPNDDAALIALSNLCRAEAGQHELDQYMQAVEDEINRRRQIYERSQANQCVECGATYNTNMLPMRHAGPGKHDWAHVKCPTPGDVIPIP